MLVFKIKKIFAVALLQIFPVMLFAQSKLDSLQHLDEVVITARIKKSFPPNVWMVRN